MTVVASLGDFISDHRGAIVASWRERARALRPARALSERALVDHLPDLLSRVGALVAGAAGEAPLDDAQEDHALDRLSRGFDLEEVALEYALARDCVLEVYERHRGESCRIRELRALDAAFDRCVREASARFVTARHRMLRAIDQVTEEAVGSVDRDAALLRMLERVVETMEVVHGAAILLGGPDALVARAATGLPPASVEALADSPVVRRVATVGEPSLLRAADDPSGLLAGLTVETLHVVPLLHAGRARGIGVLGSRTGLTFSREDRFLFEAMASRVASVVVQAELGAAERRAREEAERALAELDALYAASPIGLAVVDPELRYLRINPALAAINGRPVEAHLGRTIREVVPEIAPLVEPLFQQVLRTGRAVQTETELVAPGAGDPRALAASVFPVHGRERPIGVGAVVVDVTEAAPRRREAEARAAELTAVIEGLPDAVLLGDAERFRMANAAALALFAARGLEDLPGDPVRVSAPLEPRLASTGEPLLAGHGPFARALAGEEVVDEVVVRSRSTGETLTMRVAAGPVRVGGALLGAALVLSDVSERRRAAEAQRLLARAGALLAESLDLDRTLEAVVRLAVPDLADGATLYLLEPDGRLRVTDPAYTDPDRAAVARELLLRFPPDPSAGVLGEVLRTGAPAWSPSIAFSGPVEPERRALLERLGIESYVFVPLRARGRSLGALALVTAGGRPPFAARDLDLAQELARGVALAIDNARLYGPQRRAVRMREETLAVVSHDLRSPLSVVGHAATVLARLADEGRTGADLARPLDAIRRSVARMERQIGDLLDLAAIESGGLAIHPRSEEVAAVLAEAVEPHLPVAQAKRQALVVEPVDPALWARCDRGRVVQVLSNLVENATKFTPAGGSVRVAAVPSGEEVRFSVTDTGPGVPPAQQARLFQAYERGGDRTTRGTGLGLYVSKAIVEAHGGRIGLESEVGVGTTVWFTLPSGSSDAPTDPP